MLNHISTGPLAFVFSYQEHGLIVSLLIGLIIGAIAKLLMPGKDPGGCIITSLLGLAGAAVGTGLGRVFFNGNYVAGFIMSVVGAILLLVIYRMVTGRRGGP
jgi:uncharacterized membrane protein YeaQ/YmgE (transglycosylase-associated protein family)